MGIPSARDVVYCILSYYNSVISSSPQMSPVRLSDDSIGNEGRHRVRSAAPSVGSVAGQVRRGLVFG